MPVTLRAGFTLLLAVYAAALLAGVSLLFSISAGTPPPFPRDLASGLVGGIVGDCVSHGRSVQCPSDLLPRPRPLC